VAGLGSLVVVIFFCIQCPGNRKRTGRHTITRQEQSLRDSERTLQITASLLSEKLTIDNSGSKISRMGRNNRKMSTINGKRKFNKTLLKQQGSKGQANQNPNWKILSAVETSINRNRSSQPRYAAKIQAPPKGQSYYHSYKKYIPNQLHPPVQLSIPTKAGQRSKPNGVPGYYVDRYVL